MKRTLLILSLVLMSCCAAVAQGYSAPQVEISTEKARIGGKLFYVHKVEARQTIYAICKAYGYAITGIKCREAILESEDGFSTSASIPRDRLIRTQTPQTFRLKNIINVHEEAKVKGITDSVASCTLIAEVGGREMHIVPGSEKNIKITTVEDLEILKALMHTSKEDWLK